jgi:hypothetical protein
MNIMKNIATVRRAVSLAASALAFVVVVLLDQPASAGQSTYQTPSDAFTALVTAARTDDTKALLSVLGPGGDSLVVSGDPVADKEALGKFVAAYDEFHRIEFQDDMQQATLVVGSEEWPMPIPAVMQKGTWHLDSEAGLDEILNRRIGRNELSVIEVCQAYVDAQREYASVDRDNNRFIEYAQKFLSSSGKHDGLYWPTSEGEEQSPLGPLVVEAQSHGYTVNGKTEEPSPYYGYFYRILYGQGPHAAGGAYDYIVNGHMVGGFALVAYPAQYGVTGIMTFIVNQDDVIYQKDFGPKTASIVATIKLFDPGNGWVKQQAN